jgi:molybdenum cofactor cytidylyltransferase
MVAAIVLSGGASRRMGRPKALLTLGGETFLSRIVRVLREGGASDLTVVAGPHHDAIEAHLRDAGAIDTLRLIRNPDAAADQMSSLRLALGAVADDPGVDAVVVALVDHPLIDPATVRALIRTRDETGAPVVRPVCDGRHGHPVIFSRETFEMLRFSDLPDGAKGVLRAFASREVLMPTTDRGVLVDVDTPDDYREIGVDGAP